MKAKYTFAILLAIWTESGAATYAKTRFATVFNYRKPLQIRVFERWRL